MKILGIESSCDETAASIVEDGRMLLSSAVNSQAMEHRMYGGVVPEIASRRHIENIVAVTEQAITEARISKNDIDAVAVTYAPGLIGALLSGLGFAKGLSYSLNRPLVPVHHLRGHIAALYLTHHELKPPFVTLVASGGHSHLVIVHDYTEFEVVGRAVDDAAGEAFDKVARTLGLPYPGGPEIARLALQGNQNAIRLPVPHTDNPLDVSFSGLKTAVINLCNQAKMRGETLNTADIAASFQSRVVEMLATRLATLAAERNMPASLCGGVAINKELERRCSELCAERGIKIYWPEPKLCGDNAAMIASAGYYEFISGSRASYSQNAYATKDIC